jgi:hypothetical protein
MVYYDYINIGINDNDDNDNNDNDNDNDNKRGIIIEQNKEKLDKITNIKNCIKLNMCISNYEDKCNITIEKGIFEVYVRTLYQIMINFNIEGVYKLNLSSNSNKILEAFFEENKNNIYLPHIITSIKEDISNIDGIKKYYDFIKDNNNQYYKLNLTKLKNKRTFTLPIYNYYIDNDNDNNENNYKDTLIEAKEYCIKNNCSGITFKNNKYQIMKCSYFNYNQKENKNENEIYSCLYL